MNRHAYWLAALLFAALVLANFDSHTGFTSLIRFGQTWQDRCLGKLSFSGAPRSLSLPGGALARCFPFLFLILSSWVWSGYWAVCRAVLPMTIASNLLLPANRRFWPLWIFGNLTLLHGVWRFL